MPRAGRASWPLESWTSTARRVRLSLAIAARLSIARGDLLVFVDPDVVAPPASLAELQVLFGRDPAIDAAFGAYDEEPIEPNFISQYKNLAHSYIHQSANPVAQTFWAGFGAVRANAFRGCRRVRRAL